MKKRKKWEKRKKLEKGISRKKEKVGKRKKWERGRSGKWKWE